MLSFVVVVVVVFVEVVVGGVVAVAVAGVVVVVVVVVVAVVVVAVVVVVGGGGGGVAVAVAVAVAVVVVVDVVVWCHTAVVVPLRRACIAGPSTKSTPNSPSWSPKWKRTRAYIRTMIKFILMVNKQGQTRLAVLSVPLCACVCVSAVV